MMRSIKWLLDLRFVVAVLGGAAVGGWTAHAQLSEMAPSSAVAEVSARVDGLEQVRERMLAELDWIKGALQRIEQKIDRRIP